MKTGKISESVYNRSCLKQFEKEQFIKKEDAGTSCVFFSDMCFETQTFGLNHETVVSHAIFLAANQVLAKKAVPKVAMIQVVLTTRQSESFLKKIMKQASETLKKYEMLLGSLQVEVVEAVMAPIATVSVVGMGKEDFLAEPGLDIVMAGGIAMGATATLSHVDEENLSKKYATHFIKKAQSFFNELNAKDIIKDGKEAQAMYAVGKGGVFASLWEMAQKAGVGMTIDLKAIPIKQEAIEVCEVYDINPYEALGTGAVLFFTREGDNLVEKLTQNGHLANVIGKTTNSNDRVLLNGEETRFLEPAKPDEILKVINK